MRNATVRRIEILQTVMRKRKVQASELALEHHVSVSTIYRDIDLLSTYFPIYTVTGKGGGVFIVEGYSLRRIYLTEEQEKFLEELKRTLTGREKTIVDSILERFSKNYDNRNGNIRCAQ